MKRLAFTASVGLLAAAAFAPAGAVLLQDLGSLDPDSPNYEGRQAEGPEDFDGEMPAQEYGWQKEPEPILPEEIERPLTELERLSISSTGLQYGRNTYDSRTDNPLEPVSVTLRALDKITARYTDLVIDMDATAKFGTLAITPRTCDKRPPEEVPEITAFLEIDATDDFVRLPGISAEDEEAGLMTPVAADTGPVDLAGAEAPAMAPEEPGAMPETVADTDLESHGGGLTDEDDDHDSTLFNGWMFASSPALNALEHPVYDVWVVDCRMIDPSI